MTIGTLLNLVGVTGAVVAAGWGFHRLCLHLEKRGYLYYRTRSKGGGGGLAGVFHDMDRLTRPSVEHVIRVQDEADADDRSDIGGR